MIFGIEPDWDWELGHWGEELTLEAGRIVALAAIADVSRELRGGDAAHIYRELLFRMTEARHEPDITEIRAIADDIAAAEPSPG